MNEPCETRPLTVDDGWRRIYVVMHDVIEVCVPADAYEDTTDADTDTELHEFINQAHMRLVSHDGMNVITDPDLVNYYANIGPSWVMAVTHDRHLPRVASPVLPAREEPT